MCTNKVALSPHTTIVEVLESSAASEHLQMIWHQETVTVDEEESGLVASLDGASGPDLTPPVIGKVDARPKHWLSGLKPRAADEAASEIGRAHV